MKRIIRYKAIDPYYSDFEETFISTSYEGLDKQQYEFEKYLGREHTAGIKYIYEAETIYDDEQKEREKFFNSDF